MALLKLVTDRHYQMKMFQVHLVKIKHLISKMIISV